MEKNYSEADEILQNFLGVIGREHAYEETVKCDGNGRKSVNLDMDCGFHVELTDQDNEGNSAEMRCWWNEEEKRVPINTSEQLLTIFFHKLS